MNRAAFALPLTALLVLPAHTQSLSAQLQAGHWEGVLQLPGGKLDLIVDLSSKEGGWKGDITIPAQGVKELALTNISVADGRLQFTLPGIPGDPRFDGAVSADGAVATGMFIQGSAQLPLTLRRTSGTATVARKTEEVGRPHSLNAGERAVHFLGFNAFPLNATVLAGGAHPYFAVLVAGSGPTDRDWSSPLLPMASHGGRDMAAWLQRQGIGSLRFDKRFIGSKDPKLDISLDAQVGDIKAAMKAARALPEAKGKKLLLVGHSEGALLALLTAGEADAALLLAMPGMSMGRLILAQVKAQLDAAGAPADVSALNLGYLGSALQAIRANQELPKAPGGVAPGIATLVRGLGRPESRGFVRDLMDLEPWGAAQRLPVPFAVAWGDRDIQTWKPETLPADFKGTVIQIPEANHLFKRETRAKAGLSGAAAISAYGDDTPMADLSLLAAWLKALR
jgi:hypothetical protein